MEFFKISECSGKVFCFVISELFPYKLFWSDYLQWYLSWITNVIYHEIQSGRIKTITKHFHQNNMMPRSLFSVYNFCNRHLVCQKYVREMTCNNVFYFGFVDVRFVQLSLVQNWIVWWRKKKITCTMYAMDVSEILNWQTEQWFQWFQIESKKKIQSYWILVSARHVRISPIS